MKGHARFIRLITMNVKRGKGNSFVRMFERDIASSSINLKGLRRLYLLRSHANRDDFVVLSFWNTKRDAERYATGEQFNRNAVKLAKYLRKKQRTSKFDVQLHTVGEAFEPGE